MPRAGAIAGVLAAGFLTFAGNRAAASDSPWRHRLVAGSLISLVLWLVIVYASSWLMVAA